MPGQRDLLGGLAAGAEVRFQGLLSALDKTSRLPGRPLHQGPGHPSCCSQGSCWLEKVPGPPPQLKNPHQAYLVRQAALQLLHCLELLHLPSFQGSLQLFHIALQGCHLLVTLGHCLSQGDLFLLQAGQLDTVFCLRLASKGGGGREREDGLSRAPAPSPMPTSCQHCSHSLCWCRAGRGFTLTCHPPWAYKL